MQQIETVKIKIARRDGRFYISSDDVPGLWLWGSDLGKLFEDVAPTIQDLYRMNRGIDVEVQESIGARLKRWMMLVMMVRLVRTARDEYKIYHAAVHT